LHYWIDLPNIVTGLGTLHLGFCRSYFRTIFIKGITMMRTILIAAMLMVAHSLTLGVNNVYLDIVKNGQDKNADTLFVGGHYVARIYITNDVSLGEIRVPLRFWGGIVGKDGSATAGHYWDWLDVGGYGTTTRCVNVVPGSRMDPPNTIWDSEFTVIEWNMNEVSPDTLGIEGVAADGGLPSGSGQHMISIHFTPRMTTFGLIMLWADTAHIAPPGEFMFYDMVGTPIHPSFSSPGQWAIALVCGDANGDANVNVGDAVFLINYVFKSGPAPVPRCAGNANGDANVNVGDAVYLINYVFKGGPAPDHGCCP
jgi:hypothetical protein